MTRQKKSAFALYKKHFVDNDFERFDLFQKLAGKYRIKNVLYPGSFVHITPSLVFPRVVYVDSYKKAEDFFKDPSICTYIQEHKNYSQEAEVLFHKSDYNKNFGEKECSFDLLISQWAGFISKACKKYLKIGGLLVANNSHRDASMASIDNDYEFIAVYNNRGNNYTISGRNLDQYFVRKSNTMVTKEYVENAKRGISYRKTASGYIFKRVN
ncbi:hypothetical protein ACFLXN_02155 [Chloroflexota bacterium]